MQAKYSRANFLPCLVAKQYSTHDNRQNSFSHRFKQSRMLRSRRTLGFTLLEVMVALAIFATAAIALTKVAMQYTQATANAILRTKAQFVALNEVANMEINQEWLQGTQSEQGTQQGEMWQIDKSAQSTISPNVQRIEVQVSLLNADSGKVQAGITHLVFFNYKAKV